MAHRVVCVSLVTGAGGETIGRSVAERLGFRYVDDEIIQRAADAAGVDPTVVAQAEHHQRLIDRIIDALFSHASDEYTYLYRAERGDSAADEKPSVAPPPEELRRLIQHAILEVGRRGQAVIVAHAASMALAGQPDILRVHVIASRPARIRRMWLTNSLLNEEQAASAIDEADEQRQKYLARFYGIDEESPTHYDLLINTDVLDVAQAVAAIVAAATTTP